MSTLDSKTIEYMRERLQTENDPILRHEVNLFDRAQRQLAKELIQQSKDDFQFAKLSKSLKQNMNAKQFFIFLGVVCRKFNDRTFFNENNGVAEYVGCKKTRELTREEFVAEFGN